MFNGINLNQGNSFNWANMMMGNSGMTGAGNIFSSLAQNKNFWSQNSTSSLSFMNVRSAAESLRSSLQSITGSGIGSNTPFGSTTPVSDNTNAMTIGKFDTNRIRNSNVSSFSVEIQQVATAQKNEGTQISSNASAIGAGFTQGNNQISLNIGGSQFDFNFQVSATDTVGNVQQRIVATINSANKGVTASISSNTGSGTGALVLQSSSTGINTTGQPNFSVSGDSASRLGVENITQQAQNASFRINRGFTGALQSSKSNDISLGFGINAQLREAGTVKVNMTSDTTAQVNSMRDMVNNVNALIQASQSNAGRGGSRLEQQLSGLMSANSASLSRVGISVNRNGFLSIDEKRMQSSAENGTLERFATDGGRRGSFGFINRLERTVDNAISNPGSLVGSSQNNRASALNAQRMNQIMQTGMLFDAWF